MVEEERENGKERASDVEPGGMEKRKERGERGRIRWGNLDSLRGSSLLFKTLPVTIEKRKGKDLCKCIPDRR